jgi:hypothetical protein
MTGRRALQKISSMRKKGGGSTGLGDAEVLGEMIAIKRFARSLTRKRWMNASSY